MPTRPVIEEGQFLGPPTHVEVIAGQLRGLVPTVIPSELIAAFTPEVGWRASDVSTSSWTGNEGDLELDSPLPHAIVNAPNRGFLRPTYHRQLPSSENLPVLNPLSHRRANTTTPRITSLATNLMRPTTASSMPDDLSNNIHSLAAEQKYDPEDIGSGKSRAYDSLLAQLPGAITHTAPTSQQGISSQPLNYPRASRPLPKLPDRGPLSVTSNVYNHVDRPQSRRSWPRKASLIHQSQLVNPVAASSGYSSSSTQQSILDDSDIIVAPRSRKPASTCVDLHPQVPSLVEGPLQAAYLSHYPMTPYDSAALAMEPVAIAGSMDGSPAQPHTSYEKSHFLTHQSIADSQSCLSSPFLSFERSRDHLSSLVYGEDSQSPESFPDHPSDLHRIPVGPQIESSSSPSPSHIGLQVASTCSRLITILKDRSKYKAFLDYRDETAQSLLNLLQSLLDYPQLEVKLKSKLMVALLRLVKKSDLYPECFALKDLELDGEFPITGGHFGDIWKGWFHKHSVCVKVIKLYRNSTNVDRLLKAFSREGVLWGQLSHRNVLPFYGIYHLNNRICLVSPWMENGNINDFLVRNPDVDRLLLVSDVADGISYLHRNNIIHGDLKGANILVTASRRACLADFGLSSVTDTQVLKWTSLSSSTPRGGTVRWQAPELIDPECQDVHTTKASDIYAFACVCYEIFTGNRPFYNVVYDVTVMLKVIRGIRPTRPFNTLCRCRGLTDTVWELMEDCWKQQPKDRPTAVQVIYRLFVGITDDRRPSGDWEDLSPSVFRASVHDRAYTHLPVMETLRVLETIGFS